MALLSQLHRYRRLQQQQPLQCDTVSLGQGVYGLQEGCALLRVASLAYHCVMLPLLLLLLLLLSQEMTLEQYEALLAEKKAELNKARVVKTIDASEFANLKVVKKDEEEEDNPLEVGAGFGRAVRLGGEV